MHINFQKITSVHTGRPDAQQDTYEKEKNTKIVTECVLRLYNIANKAASKHILYYEKKMKIVTECVQRWHNIVNKAAPYTHILRTPLCS
jgi:hypothetical protein